MLFIIIIIIFNLAYPLTFACTFIFTRTHVFAFVRTHSWKSTRKRWGRLELATSAIIYA